MGWNDFMLRSYDPQIGRFLQHDPYDQFASGYVGMGNDPGNGVDEDGGCFGCALAKAVDLANVANTLDNVTVTAKKLSSFGKFFKKAGKFAKGVGIGLGTSALNTVVGIANVVTDPIGTGKALVNVVTDVANNPQQAWQDLQDGVKDVVNTVKSGDPEAIGKLIGEGAGNFIPGGAIIKNVSRLGKVGKGVAKIARKVPCGCFIAGTLIFTDAGAKPIEQIDVGDIVWAYNDTTGQYGKKRVKTLFTFERDSVFHIKVGTDVIKATSDHPFYIGGRWLRVAELKVGDSVKLFDGSNLVIEQITVVPGRTTVYNFEVEDYHTYYVGDRKVLVHNSDCPTLNGGKRIDNTQIKYAPDKRGNAPIGEDGHPIELHHTDQSAGNSSPLNEMTRTDHRLGDNYRQNHTNTGGSESTVDRNEFKSIKRKHFTSEFEKGSYNNLPKKPKK